MNRVKLLMIIIISVSTLSSCGILCNKNKENNIDSVKSYCEKYASEYDVIESGDNGAVQVSVEAPDFCKIVENIIGESGDQSVTVSEIEDEVNRYPEYTKEYNFWVDKEEDSEIRKAFLDEVSKELIIYAIRNTEFKDEWSVEE